MKNIFIYALFLAGFVILANSPKIYDYLSGNAAKKEAISKIEMAKFEINKYDSYKNYFCNEEYTLKDLCNSTYPYFSEGEKICDKEDFAENLFFKQEFKNLSQGLDKSPESCSVLKVKFDKEIQFWEDYIMKFKISY